MSNPVIAPSNGETLCFPMLLNEHPMLPYPQNELCMIPKHDDDDDSPYDDSINFEFACYLAEGSKTCMVSNFSSMVELYDKIAQCFDISPKEIMYCTLNTPKVNMDQILGGQIGLEDTIYVHRKGNRKHVEITKTEWFLGLTIADNGNGCSYIKKIKEDSTASRVPFIRVGDHIESIMEQSMVGHRHYEVARFLKSIPLNKIFTLTLIEPVSSGFQFLSSPPPRNGTLSSVVDKALQSNRKCNTLRIRNNELTVMVEQHSANEALMSIALRHINKQLEKFIGINDDELAEELWRLAVEKNPHEFALSIEHSNLNEFKFNQEFLFDVWAIVRDVLNGRLT